MNTKFSIVFATDLNYLPYTLFAIAQIRKVSTLPVDIIIFSTELSGTEFDFTAHNIIFHPVEAASIKELPASERLTLESYLRILAPSLIPQYERILYLDVDTYLQNDCLGQLFSMDMDGHAIAAVHDQINWRGGLRNRMVDYCRHIGVTADDYFNAGVLLIDAQKYREQELTKNILAFAHENAAFLELQDQSAMNGYLKGDWKRLPLVWNWQLAGLPTNMVSAKSANILHFNGTKPWHDRVDYWLLTYAKDYRTYLGEAWPEHAKRMKPPQSWRPVQTRIDYTFKSRSIKQSLKSLGYI